ncbi:hypothetical protein BDW02DRAFT_576898 [Decorospora gaudefroyi]|uniref:2EXR domain-containing protein n=1 Tax=Decorospora gaudefroyi TaxID=184978 RepID=A0A6A5KP83_9PLEO|nr:hypothetical protein BDW02DRAFT_576898 [Decorospora gaudefroyi]
MATATAYYFAAHFNMPRAHAIDTPFPTTLSNPPVPTTNTLALPTTQALPNQSITGASAHAHLPIHTTQPASQSTSLFFRLPAELRNQIYELLLCPNTPRTKDLSTYHAHHNAHLPPTISPAILSTCHRIHHEAKNLPYTTHIFHAHPSLLTALPHLLSPLNPVLCPEGLTQIRRWQLTLRLDTDPRFSAEQARLAFSGAEFLEIRVWQSMFGGCDEGVLALFLGVRRVRVARVGGCADMGFERWLERRMMMLGEEEGEEVSVS